MIGNTPVFLHTKDGIRALYFRHKDGAPVAPVETTNS